MKFLVAHFLVFFVVATFALPVVLHARLHGVDSLKTPFLSLAFFLPLNSLICLWEISLGLNIDFINKDYMKLKEKFGSKPFDAVMQFFLAELAVQNIFSFKFWTKVWSTYSLYDPSYSNRESFGFFVDVGNGWSTLLPSLLFLIGMTFEIVDARTLGMLGLVKFYQEFYGTCIYFLSFILNKRYKGRSALEMALFVGLSNGLWFVFPLIGMISSVVLIRSDSYEVFR